MVKPDLKRNYYADLEVPNDASVDDIKKAYRKLALKYHPDRNPGQEEVYNSKFQAIQAANEILSDPVTKTRYDADRRKAGFGAGAGAGAGAGRPTVPPRTGNPYQTTSAYPPPPRRTPNPTASWRSTTGSSGADRFANFPKPAPTSKKDSTDRANVFNAWQNMNHSKPQPAGAQTRPSPQRPRPPPPPRQDTRFPSEEDIRAGMKYRQAPTSAQTGSSASQAGSTNGQAGPTNGSTGSSKEHPGFRSAWAEFNATNAGKPGMAPNIGRSNTTKTPRKAGFDLNAAGDEGQAGSTANYSSFRRKSTDPTFFPPPPPRETHSDFSSRSQSQQGVADPPFTEGSRAKTAYSSHIGQQTYSSGEDPNRNASNVNSEPSTRQSSARRPAGRTGTARKPFVVYSSSEDSATEEESPDTSPEIIKPNAQPNADNKSDNPSRPFVRPKKTPNPPSRQFKNGMPFADSGESGGNGMPNNSNQPDFSAESAGSEKDRPSMYGNNFLSPTPSSQKDWSQAWPFGTDPGEKKSQTYTPKWAFPSTVRPGNRTASGAQRAWHDFAQNALKDYIGRSRDSQPDPPAPSQPVDPFAKLVPKTQDGGVRLGVSPASKKPCFTKKDVHHLFTMPVGPETFAPNVGKSRSEDNINTTFTPSQWAGTFTSNNVFAAPQSANRPRESRKLRRQPSVTQEGTRQPSNADATQQNATQQNATQQNATQQNATQQNATASPPQQPVKFSAEEWAKTIKDPTWLFDPEALRSASPQRSSARNSRSNSSAKKGSRKIPVTNPKPATVHVTNEQEEVAVEDPPENVASVDEMDLDATPPANTTPPPFSAANPTQEPRMYHVDTAKLHRPDGDASKPATAGSSMRDDGSASTLKTKLDDLANAINTPSEGLEGLCDIRTNLPFQSKASTVNPSKVFTPQVLQLPPLPRAPETPTKLSKSSWAEYCHVMASYLEKFDKFNSTMLDHFSTRQAKASALVRAGVRALEAIGEASTTTGFPSYAQGVKEDERVREHWNIGCEKHAEAVKAFEAVRERVRVLSEGAGLSDV